MTISHANPSQLRPSGDDPHGLGPIIRIGPDRRAEAVARLLASGPLADRDHARKFLDYARDRRINLDGLWSRLDRQGRIEATVLAVPNPGRTAMVFASHPTGRGQIQSAAGLIDEAAEFLREKNVNLAQALLEPEDELDGEVFRAAGFQDLAILSYLERPVRSSRLTRRAQLLLPQGLTAIHYDENRRGELIDLLHRTYEDTMDCPGLRGHRQTEDILEGHRASGMFDARLWTILRLDNKPIGAMLMNPSPDHHSIELVYLGLVKEVRGRGYGAQLLRFGLNLLQNRGERVITLAVDESNAPALALYRGEGFKSALRRRAMIRPIS